MQPAEILTRLQKAQAAALRQDWQEAEALLAPLLEPPSEHPGALHLRGLIALEQGQQERAWALLEGALSLGAPESLQLFLAQQYFQARRFAAALRHYEAIFARQLQLEDADLHRFALSLHETGALTVALDLYRQLLSRHPQHADLHMHLGNALLDLGENEAALQALRQAVALAPEALSTHYNLARACLRSGDLQQVETELEWILSADPNHAPAWLLRARVFELQGQAEAALEACRKAVHCAPAWGSAWYNLGLCALKLYQGPEAEQALHRALNYLPGDPQVIQQLARLERNRGQAEQAQKRLADLSQSHPVSRYHEAFILPPVYRSQAELTAWQTHFSTALDQLEALPPPLQDPAQEVPVLPFYLAYTGLEESSLKRQMSQLARIFGKACPELGQTVFRPRKRSQGAKIRLGICSSALRPHTVFQLFGHLWETLDSERFEIITLALGGIASELRPYLQRHSQICLDLPEDDVLARQTIVAAEVDFLLYLDIGMHPLTWYLSLGRLAPCQGVLWGHGITTGSPALDAFFSATTLDLESGQEYYAEPLWRLPSLTGQWRLPQPLETVIPLDLAAQGLPAGRRYLCPQSLYKMHPNFDRVLAGVLERDPQAQLILLQGLYPEWEAVLRERWRGLLDRQRVHFLPRLSAQDYLSLLAAGDVMLDPWPFGGGLTLMQALSLGTPVVTRTGQSLKNRLGTAIGQQMGWLEGGVTSEDEYLERALVLAERGREMGSNLAQSYAESVNVFQAGKDLGDALVQIWQKYELSE